MRQTALPGTRTGALPASIGLSLAEHMHAYESLTITGASVRPPQIVIGNSGVSLASHPRSKYFKDPVTVDGEQALGNTLKASGLTPKSEKIKMKLNVG